MTFRLVNFTNIKNTEYDPSSTVSLVQNWGDALPQLKSLAESGQATYPLSQVKLVAPLLYPSNIFCAGANYSDHYKEMSGRDPDKSTIKPYFFNKVVRQTVIGPNENILYPKFSKKLDWEAEICVIIGKPGRHIKRGNALEHVAGVTIINDLSARDFLFREDWPALKTDWLWQKSFDTSAPMGPWLTPISEVPDAQNLKINTYINDDLRQDTSSKFMIFSIPELIEALSEHFTLLAGDAVATGTGSGVGHPADSYLKPGDTCRIEIESLGVLENPIIEGN